MPLNPTNYWKLDGNSTDVVAGNNGTDTAVTYSSANGRINQGAGFNGTTSKITLGTGIGFPTNFSFSAWINWTSGQTIFGDSNTNATTFWEVGVVSGGKIILDWTKQGGDNVQYTTSDVVISSGIWTHVAITQTGTSNAIIYINGISVAVTQTGSSSSATKPTAQGTAIGQLGAYTGAETLWSGTIDEVYIDTLVVLTAGSVTALFRNGSGLQYPFNKLGGMFF